MLIKPLSYHVFVKPEKAKETVGSIYLPDGTRFEQRMGTVRAVGPGMWRGADFVPMTLKPGDKVVYGQYSGQKMSFTYETVENGITKIVTEELIHMREDEVYCVLEDYENILEIKDLVE